MCHQQDRVAVQIANIAHLHRFPAGTGERRNGLEEGCQLGYDEVNCCRPVARVALVSPDGASVIAPDSLIAIIANPKTLQCRMGNEYEVEGRGCRFASDTILRSRFGPLVQDIDNFCSRLRGFWVTHNSSP